MTRKISRPMLAIALAFGLLAAVSSSSHAALSTADRTAPAAAPAAVEATATQGFAADAPVAAKPTVATATPVAQQPQKAIVHKAKPRFAAISRFGYPCR